MDPLLKEQLECLAVVVAAFVAFYFLPVVLIACLLN